MSASNVPEVEDHAMSAETVLSPDIVGAVELQAAQAIDLIVLLSSAPGSARTRMKSIEHVVNMYHDTLHAAVIGHHDESDYPRFLPAGSGSASEVPPAAASSSGSGTASEVPPAPATASAGLPPVAKSSSSGRAKLARVLPFATS